jgi:hypothetical protein
MLADAKTKYVAFKKLAIEKNRNTKVLLNLFK